MDNTIETFHVSKIITTRRFNFLIKVINANTRDAYISDQARIRYQLWLLRVTCSWRDDAEFVRSL